MSEPAMAFVELLRVAAVQELHSARELVPRGVEDEVVVRRHQAERMERPLEALDAATEVCQELAAVVVVEEDVAAVDAPRDHVEVAVGERRAEHARHDSMKPHDRCGEAPCGRTGTNSSRLPPSRADVSRV